MISTQLTDVGLARAVTLDPFWLEGLCPTGVAVAVWNAAELSAELHSEEESAVASALESRRQEFGRGRACARQALRRLGATAVSIPARADRGPQWPAGIVGSITHTADVAAAAVAWRDVIAGIGIDIESRDRDMRASLDRFICTPAERASLPDLMLGMDGLRLVFSAKESVYKCVAPLSGVALGFHDVELDVDVAGQSFRARPATARAREVAQLSSLSGRFVFTPRLVITAATILAAGGGVSVPQSTKE